MISCGLRSFWSCPSLFTPPQSRVNVDKIEKYHFKVGLRITESQNESGWKEPQWFIRSNLPAQGGLSHRTGHRTVSRWVWNISSGGDFTPSLDNLFQWLVTAQKSFSSHSGGTSWASASASCPIACHRVWLHPLTPSLHILICTSKSCLLSARWEAILCLSPSVNS